MAVSAVWCQRVDLQHMNCHTCKGQLWVCESHPVQSWPHCEGAGMPCTCNPDAMMPPGFKAVVEVSRKFERGCEPLTRIRHTDSSNSLD